MTNSKETILAQLARIVNSKTFAKTAINVKLLSFLVHSSLNNKEVKEVTIGTEMFGKKYDPIKNDNKVRVYVYHLRKKLEKYYQEEANYDEIIFSIAKGQYLVQFLEFNEDSTDPRQKKRISLGISTVTIIAVLAIVYIGYVHIANNSFWTENFNKKYPTTVIIGDHYTLLAPIETGGSGLIRDFDINSDDDFNSYIQKHPDKVSNVTPNKYSYITKMGASCSKNISQYFSLNGLNFNLILSSEWEMSKINDENIVYIGQSKNMRSLKNILLESFPNLSFQQYNIVRSNPETGEKTLYNDSSSDVLVDYTLIAKTTGPNGNSYKFFLSDHDGGVISSMKYFTNNDSIKKFYSRHQIGKRDFVALFKVSGWERTGYNMEFEWIDFGE